MSGESIFIASSLLATSRIILLGLIVWWIPSHSDANRYPPFQILAILPQEQAPQISRELRRALAEWEESNKPSSALSLSSNLFGSVASVSRSNVPDISLFAIPVPVSNDSDRILSSLCDSLEVHNPSLILSLLDRPRNFYSAIIAQSASLPIISLTQEYRQQSSLQKVSDTWMQISLDTAIWSLSDATFEVLRAQHWFDAILLVDDTISSDLFSYRLIHLCNTNAIEITNKGVSLNGSNKMFNRSTNHNDVNSWKNLMIIQLSQALLQPEFYLRMAEIQTSHRRVILIHCDRSISKRIITTAESLGLFDGHKIWLLLDGIIGSEISSPYLWKYLNLPTGMIALRHRAQHIFHANILSSIIHLIGQTAASVYKNSVLINNNEQKKNGSVPEVSCWHNTSAQKIIQSDIIVKELTKRLISFSSSKAHHSCKPLSKPNIEQTTKQGHILHLQQESKWPSPVFDILNLVPAENGPHSKEWKIIGNVTKDNASINSLQYIGSPSNEHYAFSTGKHRFRVVTNIAPPFVIESTKLDNNTCLTGEFCLKVNTSVRDDLISIFTDFRSSKRKSEGKSYHVHCCAGIAIDLLNAVARDLNFEYDLYIVKDGLFGVRRKGQWDGITADLVNDLAHLSFTAFSTTSSRVQAIDYSVPFFYSGVSCLSMSTTYSDVPLSAFLIPFSTELWVAIFASLLATAIAAAIYEWFSPFGLNPWGRQRTKNFSLASALWVMCSLLFSHLVAFKAPKSWPNKVLINVWGAFSVIFLATYTANIAAHFAGLFLIPEVNDFHDASLMKQRTGTARSSASEGYLMEKYTELWNHIEKYKVHNFDEGLQGLRNKTLDVLIGDTAILDFYRATDPECHLRLLGDSIFDDAYAVGMQKGFPLRELISSLILKYNEYGFLDQLHRKWYGRIHCLESSALTKPKPLTVRAVAGVFMMLGFGLIVGILILFSEHIMFKYFLPSLRKKNKECFWKSPNLMFFSQKLYRFINTVELVSPHHSAKEIMSNLREGQIASLFQKSVKRKTKEEARRRKSKSQFFETIKEVRKVVQQQRSFQDDSIEVTTTKPLYSSISQTESLETIPPKRQPAIRFKDPEEETYVRREPLPPNKIIKIQSKLKSSTDSRLQNKLSKLKSKYGSNSSLQKPQTQIPYKTPLPVSESVPKSRYQLPFVTSFSLENVFNTENQSYDSNRAAKRQKTWSYDDLMEIKRELNKQIGSSNRDHSSVMLYEIIPKKTSVIIPSPRHISLIENLRLSAMTKEDIFAMWRSSERELLNQLQDALQQKRALEERVALLQRMLMKPP